MHKVLSFLKYLYTKDRFFYGSLMFLVILLGQIPVILHIIHTPKGFYFPYLDKVSFSDFYYLSLIRYGMSSEWLLKIPYVVTQHKASLIQIYFIILGKISLITHLGPAEVFNISKIIGGITYLISAVLFIKIILPKNQARLGYVFFLFAQPLPTISFLKEILGSGYMNWIWHFGEAVRRVSVLPSHYTLGKGLAVIAFSFFILYLKQRKYSFAIYSGFLMFIAGMIYPPPVFIIFISIVMTFVTIILVNRAEIDKLSDLFKRWETLVFIMGCIFPILILKTELIKGYPWNRWNEVELGWNASSMQFELNYILMLGLLILLIPFSIKKIISDKENILNNLMILFWFISSFLLFPFADVLKLGKFRFIEGGQVIPFAILAFWGLEYVINFLKSKFHQKKLNLIRMIFMSIFVINYAVFTSFSLYYSVASLWGYYTNVYFEPREIEALTFIEKNIKKDTIILADLISSNYLPAFAQVRTIIGFPDSYKDNFIYSINQKEIDAILADTLSSDRVDKYLREKKVDFIYRRIDYKSNIPYYPNLMDNIYKNGKIAIYKVKKN